MLSICQILNTKNLLRNSTKKKIRNEKCKRGWSWSQIPLLLSYQSHWCPETHKTWPSFAHRFWRAYPAKNPAPLVKVPHIVACNSSLPLSPTFYRTGGRISRTFPLKALETEDKSRLLIPAHVKNLKKKKRKLAHFETWLASIIL